LDCKLAAVSVDDSLGNEEAQAQSLPSLRTTVRCFAARERIEERRQSLDQRLCRWLLMMLDRLRGTEIVMTQELLANMLGVRREGVTERVLKLRRAGLTRYARGSISILDRAAREHRACECYSVVKREYERLLPRRPTG
jgi:CRP-like cAMP-binding protein